MYQGRGRPTDGPGARPKKILDSDTCGRLTHSFLCFSLSSKAMDRVKPPCQSHCEVDAVGLVHTKVCLSINHPAGAHSHGFHQLGASSIASTGHYPNFLANPTIFFPDGRMKTCAKPSNLARCDSPTKGRLPLNPGYVPDPPCDASNNFFSNLRNTEIIVNISPQP